MNAGDVPPEIAFRMDLRKIVMQAAPDDMAQAYPQTFVGIADRISDQLIARGFLVTLPERHFPRPLDRETIDLVNELREKGDLLGAQRAMLDYWDR